MILRIRPTVGAVVRVGRILNVGGFDGRAFCVGKGAGKELIVKPLAQVAPAPVHSFFLVVERTGVWHTVGQKHRLGATDFQNAPFDGNIGKIVPGIKVGPSIMLLSVRGTGDSVRTVQPVVALTVDFRVVVRPLGFLQLAVESCIYYHVTFSQRIIVDSIKATTDYLVGGV